MFKPDKTEINHHTIKLIIGIAAISLAALTSFFSGATIESISASYYEDGWSRDIFTGFLFAIFALLLSYNGYSSTDAILSRVAAFAALGVAMFPCSCGDHSGSSIHYISAAIMFIILALFCRSFYKRAQPKGHLQAKIRANIYAICGYTILFAVSILFIDHLFDGFISSVFNRLIFWGENIGLVAFGIAWLVASRMLPLVTLKKERLSILTKHTDDA